MVKVDKSKVSVKKFAKKTAVKKAAPKAKTVKKEPAFTGPRHPHGRVKASSAGTKEALAKALAPILARGDEDKDELATRLKTASNQQLLRLQRIGEQVKKKFGSRAGLIEAIGKSENKGKDKDFIAKLESLSIGNLFDLAINAERRARA